MKNSRRHAACHPPGSALHWAVAVLAVGLSNGTGQAQGVDNCAAGPQAIAGDGLFAFDNTSATVDGSGNALCFDFGTDQFDADVWFCWTAACTGSVTIETCGLTGIDTRLAVYDGCSCTAPILACNDDTCDRQSSITINATGGNSYLLRVGTFPGSAGGTGQLRVTAATTCTCLINADCDDGNVCTRDTCANGTCTYIDTNGPCDDGLFCTSTDACLNGACVGSGDPCAGCGACDEVADACTTATVNPAFESLTSATSGDNNVSSLSIGLPGGTTAGDLLIAVLSTDTNESLSAPAGWTVIDNGTSSGKMTAGVWYRVAGAAEPASFAFTWTSNEEAAGAILRYSGVDALNPIDASASSTGTSNSPTAPSVTTTIDTTTILRLYGADDDDLLAAPYPTGHAGRFNIESSTTGGSCSAGAADIVQTAAGATGSAAFNLSASEEWRAVTVALRPPAVECTGAADCDDGIDCTDDTCACGVCVFTPNDGACDDGNPCNGAEICDPQAGSCVADSCVDRSVILEQDFDAGAGTFNYQDDTFRGTANPGFADGTYEAAGGLTGGGVRVIVGAISSNMSGGWAADFTITGSPVAVEIDLAYRLVLDGGYEPEEFGEALLSVDGALLGVSPNDYLVRLVGDGSDPAVQMDSGWLTRSFSLNLANGTHEIIVGAFNNLSTAQSEITEAFFDDIRVTAIYDASCDGPCDDGDACTLKDTCSNGVCAGTPIDCDDANPCTDDSCSNGTCINAFNTDSCDDGDACTESDTCSDGACAGTPIDCDDGNECTDDSCSDGTCVNASNTNGCDDGDACTESDTCSDGACAGTPIDCDDGNECTDDSCSDGTCINAFNTNGCDDGDACTEFDACSDGACAGTPIDCDDGNECTDDACSNGICINAFNTNGCDDGDACTEFDTCSDGACAGTVIDCDDGNECTDDSCSDGTCVNAFNTNGCDDGDACTEFDTCSDGACAGTPIDCDDGNECTDDSCSNGICINAFNTNGCDDGDACTEFDACSDGACAGTPIDCDDGNECTDDSCSDGTCVNAFNTDICDDGDACTEFDACSDGVCAGTPIDCDDGNECTDDSCSNGICINAFNTNGCDDGDACTESDTCSNGACAGASIDCDDGNECTDDSCSNGTCVNAFNTDICDDGDACTEADSCSEGICKGDPIGCDDGNPCTDDFCSNGTCLNIISTNGCDDGNDCTEFDTCVNGVCAGSTIDCDDGDACTTDVCTNGACFNEFNTNGCDDGNDCTEFDACSNGACTGTPIDCDDGNPCTDDLCAPGTGCVHDFNTTGCSDGLFCNGEEGCDGAGTCSAGTPPCPAALCNESNDACDSDCNSNGIPDADDLAGTSLDCNNNQVPDECELADHDCDTNGVPDACDIASGAPDGNANGRPDICDGPIRYVDEDAAPGGDGVSWATAYDDLQDALAEARGIGALIDEIRVGAGVYTPAGPSGDRNTNFALIDDVALRGGYAGLGAPDPDERNFDLFISALSGDLNGDDVGGFGGTAGDNAFQVVTGSHTSPTALLEGFVIERGGQIDRFGGGLSNSEGSPTVRWCTFQDNVAFTGGAIFGSSSHPLIENCRFLRNFAQNDGGAIRNAGDGILRNCLFVANSCGRDGGAIYSLRGDFTIANCTVIGNVAGRFAGGLWLPNFGNEMYNCLSWFNADSTSDIEGAQLKFSAEIGVVSHCDIQGWTGTLGGTGNIGLDPLFIDADGTDNVFGTVDDDLTLLAGTPCANTGDFYFAGLSVSDLDGDVRIQACRVDIGSDETPFAGGGDCNLNLIDDACDIAEGGLPDLNLNAIPDDCEDCALDAQCSDDIFCNGAELCVMGTCVPPAGDACLPNELCDETNDVCVAYGTGDFDDDGDLDLADFSAFQQCFGQSVFDLPTCQPGNLNGDEFVDAADFAALEGDLRGP